MAALSNVQLWNYLRDTNPNFKSHTAKGTADLFTEKGFEALSRTDVNAINDFFTLSMRVAFQKLNVSKAKNPLGDSGLVEVYDTPNGGYVQRMAIFSIKPTTPRFKNLSNGTSVDPFTVRKPETAERFFGQNFDYQSYISNQSFQIKTIFISEYGMSEYVAGILQGLINGYTVQNYTNVLNVLSGGINSVNYPLKDSQQIALSSWTDGAPTDAELQDLILNLKDLATSFEVSAQTGAFNAMGFETTCEASDFVCLMRAGIKNRIQLGLRVGAFNPEDLTIPFAIKEVENFGGLRPYVEVEGEQIDLQPIYDKNGEQVAYVDANVTVNSYATYNTTTEKWVVNVTSSGTTADTSETYKNGEVSFEDVNENIIAVVARKGIIFENIQNPYQVNPIFNPAGLYTNYWASSPNNAINYDPLYDLVTISAPSV